MSHEKQRLVPALLLSWGVFGVVGGLVALIAPVPTVAIAISRGYCPPQAWQDLSDRYRDLFEADKRQYVNISTVYLVSDLGQEALTTPPPPIEIAQIRPFGRHPEDRLSTLSTTEPQLEILSCN